MQDLNTNPVVDVEQTLPKKTYPRLLNWNSPLLKEDSLVFDFKNPPFDPLQVAQDMIGLIYEKNGMTLAGVQIGIPYRVFALRGHPENFVCFNPRVVHSSHKETRLEETTLTHPGLIVKVMRPDSIRVRFATPNSVIRTELFTGLTARAFLQSMDFLAGAPFWKNSNPIHRQQSFKKWKR